MKHRVIAFVLCVAGLAQPASAQTTFWYIGSIACDTESDVCGWATGLVTHQSVTAALQQCRSHGGAHCKIAMPSFNSCGAVSKASNNEGYWGIGMTKDLAFSRAINACEKDGGRQCRVQVSFCTPSGTLGGGDSPSYHPPSTTPSAPTPKPTPGCPYGTHPGLGGCYGY